MASQFQVIRDKLHKVARGFVKAKRLARDDGFIYTVDAAQLMIYFAQSGDAAGYDAMRDHAVTNLIRHDKADPYTEGFVCWRWKAGERIDASGTTEALRVARGLWLGSAAFNRPADADLAAVVLDGYGRHGAIDQGVWMIRNYFGFGTRAFANNSFLVDYDPDFVREMAEARHDAALTKLADDCQGVVQLAVAPCGLLYDMIQPEVKTLYPELNLAAFSPNDVIQFSNCCTTAITVARGLPAVSRRVLAFALGRLDDLRFYYLGRTGEPVNAKQANVFEYSALARLAAKLNAAPATATIAQHALPRWTYFADHAEQKDLYNVIEVLLTMHVLLGGK